MRQKVILNLVIGIQMVENSLFIIDCIYSIIYKHYEYVAMGIICVFMIILLLFLLGNTKVQIFSNKQQNIQQECLNCGKMIKDLKCKECKICINCNEKFHSNYLNKCLDKNQLQYIFKNIWLLVLKCLLCSFVRIYGMISYLSDDTTLFIVFYISLSVGVILDLIITIFLVSIQQSLSKEQINISNLDRRSDDATDVKVQSLEQGGTSGSPKLNKQMKILEFLEKKLSHRNNFVNNKKTYETQPMPIMFEENDEDVVHSHMQQLNGLIPLTLNNIIKQQ